MHLGAVTYNLLHDWDHDRIIEKLGELGYEGVELRTTHAHGVEPSVGADDRKAVRRKFEASSVKLVAYGTTCEFHSPDDAERARQVRIGKSFVDLAVDTGVPGVKVRPNALPEDVPASITIENIAAALRELGYYAGERKVDIWVEVHGRNTQQPAVMADILSQTASPAVGACWNCNGTDVVDGSVKVGYELLSPWIRHVHLHDLVDDYPYRELFSLLNESGYDGYCLVEAPASPDPERLLRYYKALWQELIRA